MPEKFAYVDGILWAKKELIAVQRLMACKNIPAAKEEMRKVLKDQARRRHLPPPAKRHHRRAKNG